MGSLSRLLEMEFSRRQVLESAGVLALFPREAITQKAEAQRNLEQSMQQAEASLKKFTALPISEQNNILYQLDNYFLMHTSVGKQAKDILRTKVPIIEDAAMPIGSIIYNPFQGVVYRSVVSNEYLMLRFLAGRPLQVSNAHEVLHHFQYSTSPWHDFVLLLRHSPTKRSLGSFMFETERPPIDKMVEFARNYMKKKVVDEKEAEKLFEAIYQKYMKAESLRTIIYETHAVLTFDSFNSNQLYSHFSRHPRHKHQVAKIGIEEFNRVFKSTLELTGILGPQEAARLVGRNGESVDGYVEAVEKLKVQRKIPFAYEAGLIRQKQLRIERRGIQVKALGYLK